MNFLKKNSFYGILKKSLSNLQLSIVDEVQCAFLPTLIETIIQRVTHIEWLTLLFTKPKLLSMKQSVNTGNNVGNHTSENIFFK